MIRVIVLCALSACLAGCDWAPPLHIHTSANEAGELWVRVNNGDPQRLLGEAQGYRPLISPDGQWLAVELRLMSNLEVVRLFRRDGQRFEVVAEDVTAIGWRKAAADRHLELEDLDRTKARVSGWSDDGATLRLALTAVTQGEEGTLEITVAIPLEKDADR